MMDALNVYDPLESINRRIYHFNYRFDQWVFLPVVYKNKMDTHAKAIDGYTPRD